jgi:hypothetical protein
MPKFSILGGIALILSSNASLRAFWSKISVIFLLAYCIAVCSDNYATWNYSGTVTLNTTSAGANVATNVLRFPILLRLNPGNFLYFSQTSAGGADIRFAKTDGTHVPYEIERWVDNTGNNDTAEIWI